MTDQVEQDVALDDDEEVINEMQDPKNARFLYAFRGVAYNSY